MLSYMIPLLTAPPQVPSLRFASGVPQGRRLAFGWHKSHPQAPPCVLRAGNRLLHQIGRASRRERVCQYVSISVGAVTLTKQHTRNNYYIPLYELQGTQRYKSYPEQYQNK